MEVDTGGLVMIAEAGAAVGRCGRTMDDVDEVGKVLSKGDYGDNTPSKRRKVASKGV